MSLSLNTSHPAYADLQAIWSFKEGTGNPLEFISSVAGALTGSATWDTEGSGVGITVPSGSSVTLGVDRFPAGRSCTVVYRGRRISAAGDQARFGTSGVLGAGQVGALVPYSDTNTYFYWGGGTDNISRLVVPSLSFDTTLDTFVFRVSATEIRAWRNGTLIGFTTGGAPPSRTNDGTEVKIGGFDFFAGLNQFVDLFAIYNSGVLSDTICADLSADPWDVFVDSAVTITPASATLAFAATAPALLPAITTPNTGNLSLAGVAPTVGLSGVMITPPVGSLAITGAAPVIVGTLPIVPAAASLVLLGLAPSLAQTLRLSLEWDADVALRDLLPLDWEVGAAEAIAGGSLPLEWSIDELLAALRLDWDVYQTALEAAYDEDPQRPWARVSTP